MTITGDGYTIIEGDCVQVMEGMDAGSVDAVITDPPYGTTACKWDTIIPFDDMWAGIKRVRKPRAAVVLFGSEPFSSLLRVSNLDEYKYDWVWEKGKPTGHLNAQIQPMRKTELISVFYTKNKTYNPQETKATNKTVSRTNRGNYGECSKTTIQTVTGYPVNLLKFNSVDGLHPTQKPVPLMEYLIKTYTNEGDMVLDFTMGSGSTGVAAMRTGRKFIGIEQDAEYFEIAHQRIANAAGDYVTTEKEKATGQTALWDLIS